MKTRDIIYIILGVIIIGGVIFLSTKQNTNAPTASPTTAGVTGTSISIKNYQFDPASLIVKKGATVIWTNNDAAPHIVGGDQNAWSAGPTMKQGDTYAHTFGTVGTFEYHCAIHPNMRGTIVVTE